MTEIIGEIKLSEELERKTIDALTSIVKQAENGYIDQYTALVATRAIFEVTSGILPQATFEYVGELLNYFTYESANTFSPILRFCEGKSNASVMFIDLLKNKLILFYYNKTNNSFIGKSKQFESKQELIEYSVKRWDIQKRLAE